MAVFESDLIPGSKPAVTCSEAGCVVAVKGKADVPNSLAANDLIKLAKLPAGYLVGDVKVRASDLDTNVSPTITITVGILNSTGDDLDSGSEFIIASTVAQAGGQVSMDKASVACDTPYTTDKIIAAKVVNAATTKAAGTVRATVEYFQP